MSGELSGCVLHAGSVPPPQPRLANGRFFTALLMAAGLHVCAILALVALKPVQLGQGGVRDDAVEVMVIVGEAVESSPLAPGVATTAEAATVNALPIDASDLARAPAPIFPPIAVEADVSVPVTASPPMLAETSKPIVTPVSTEDLITSSLPSIMISGEPPEVAPEATRVTPPPAPAAEPAGAAASIASPAADAQPDRTAAAAGAAPGVIDAYRTSVAQALRKSRPPQGRGRGGVARVVFTINGAGGVEAAAVLASSGDQAQDQMALTAVRTTRFPKPDPTLTQAQRTFPISYQFQSR